AHAPVGERPHQHGAQQSARGAGRGQAQDGLDRAALPRRRACHEVELASPARRAQAVARNGRARRPQAVARTGCGRSPAGRRDCGRAAAPRTGSGRSCLAPVVHPLTAVPIAPMMTMTMRSLRLAFVGAFATLLVLEALSPCRPVAAPPTSAHDCCAPAPGLRPPAPSCCPDASRAQDRLGAPAPGAAASLAPSTAALPAPAPSVAAPVASPPFASSPPIIL